MCHQDMDERFLVIYHFKLLRSIFAFFHLLAENIYIYLHQFHPAVLSFLLLTGAQCPLPRKSFLHLLMSIILLWSTKLARPCQVSETNINKNCDVNCKTFTGFLVWNKNCKSPFLGLCNFSPMIALTPRHLKLSQIFPSSFDLSATLIDTAPGKIKI